MAQTTDALSGVANSVEYSLNGSSWTNMSGYANLVTAEPQNRMSAVTYTFDGDTAIVTFGKREPFSITVRMCYTEDASSPWEALRALHEAAGGTAVWLRWSPKGSGTGAFEFTTPSTKIATFPYPNADASAADPILVEIVFGPVASVTKSLATT